jgi:hypothetical protein
VRAKRQINTNPHTANCFKVKSGKRPRNFSGNKVEKLPLVNLLSLKLLTVVRTKLKRIVQTVVIKKCLITSNLNFLYKVQNPIFFFRAWWEEDEEFRKFFVIKVYIILISFIDK